MTFDVSYSGSANYIYVTTGDGAVSSYEANKTQPIRVSQYLINTGYTSLEFSASMTNPNSINVFNLSKLLFLN